MEKSNAIQSQASAGSCDPILTLGGRVSRKTTVTALAAGAAGAGLFFGWDSLAALGLTTVVVAVLPCLLMCAVGMCMGMSKKDSGAGPSAVPPKVADSGAPATAVITEASVADESPATKCAS